MGRMFFTMIAGFAEYEREQIADNVRAGMARAKAQGKRISRPPIPEATKRKITELRKAGKSIRIIATELGVGIGTVHNYAQK